VLGLARKKILKKILFKKICDFPQIFYCILKYWFVFLYCKDTNPVLKYLVFVKIKKMFCFHAYGQVSKKNHIVFSYNKENLKNIY